MRNFIQNLKNLKNLKNLMQIFKWTNGQMDMSISKTKEVFQNTTVREMEGEQPTNLQVISKESLSMSPIKVAVKSRITSTCLRLALVSLFIVMGVVNVMADWTGTPTNSGGVWYVVDDPDERSIFQEESTQYNLSGPGANLTFDAYRTSFMGIGAIQNLKVSDGYSVIFDVFVKKDKYESYPTEGTLTVNANTQTLTFYGATAATLSRKIKNVKVTMADHVLLADGTVNGTGTIAKTISATAYGNTSSACHIELRSFLIAGTKIRYKITSDANSDFSFESGSRVATKDFTVQANSFAMVGGLANCASTATSIGNPENQEADVYFTPSANVNAERSATIKIYDVSTGGVETERATITVTAKVIPTYYFKATTVATAGGADVKASFSEITDANKGSKSASETTSLRDGVDKSSLSTTAYFYAPATNGDEDYFFEGWYAEEACSGTRLSVNDTIVRTITSTSLNSAAPTETKYYARYLDSIYAEFYGETSVAMKVGDTYSDGISYFRTSADEASNDSEDGFWYEIRNNTPLGITSGSAHPDSIIAYDPETKSVTAYNAGTATLVFHQHNYPYANVSKEYTFTVSKHETVLSAPTLSTTMNVDGTQTISYSATNVSATYPLEGNTNDFFFTIVHDPDGNENTTGCAAGHSSHIIGYNPIDKEITAYNAGKATLTIAQKETYYYTGDTLVLDEITVSKLTPRIIWNPSGAGIYYGSVIPNIFSGDRAGGVSYTSSKADSAIAKVSGDTLYVYSTPGTANITIKQAENYKFNYHDTVVAVTPATMPPGVPFVYKEAQYNNSLVTIEKTPYCSITDVDKSDDHILFNDGSHTGTHYVIIHFEGMPDKMTFGYKAKENAGTRVMYIQQSATNSFSDSGPILWSKSDLSKDGWTTETIQLDPTTRYLKIRFVNNTDKTCGRFRLNSITELQGYKYLKNGDKYLSRGADWATRAVMDEFGTPLRITRETSDNTNYTTKLMFMDNQDYLYETDDYYIYTDKQSNTKYTFVQEESDGKVTFKNTDSNRYFKIDGTNVMTTTTAGEATKWELEDYTEHQALMDSRVNSFAVAAAANTDLASEVSSLSELSSAVAEQYLKVKSIDDASMTDYKSIGRQGAVTTLHSYSASGLTSGLYRLTVQAFCQPANTCAVGWNNHINGMENVLAYIYAGDAKVQVKSMFDEGNTTGGLGYVEYGGKYYPTDTTTAKNLLNASKDNYLNEIYVYVSGTSLTFGICNPSSTGNDNRLSCKNFKLERVERRQMKFDGNEGSSTDWNTAANWTGGVLPTLTDAVTVSHNVEITSDATAYSVTIGSGKTVTIKPTGGLTVGAGSVSGAVNGNLVLKAATNTEDSTGQTGYLRISPLYTDTMPIATVELFSTAIHSSAAASGSKTKWQCVGAPISDEGVDIKTVYPAGTWVYSYNEASNSWVNERTTGKFVPFKGYKTSQKLDGNGKRYENRGHIVSGRPLYTIELDSTAELDGGYNLLANSFTAPIAISQFNDTDFVDADTAIYILNAGTTNQSNSPGNDVDAPGKWVSIPINTASELASAGLPRMIPSMQGFWVRARSNDAQLKLDYSRLVWGVSYSGDQINKPLRAPKRTTTEENKQVIVTGKMKISLSAEEGNDHLYLLESEAYDAAYEGGYDAYKLSSGGAEIFALTDNKEELYVDATNSLIGTQIGVRTGEMTEYTLRFSRVESENDLALYDAEAYTTTNIDEGAEYTFYAASNDTIISRFSIVERVNSPAVATGVDGIGSETKVQKFIKDGHLYVLKNGVLYNAQGMMIERQR